MIAVLGAICAGGLGLVAVAFILITLYDWGKENDF